VRILIYAPSARMGGARSHMLGLLPELAAIAPDAEFLLLAQPDLMDELPPLPQTWAVKSERAETRGFVGRFAWEQRMLPRILEAWRADVLLSFGSFVPLRSPCPSVLEAGNALPFTRAYWLLLQRESARLRLEERARWVLLRAALQAAARVLVPSRAMRQDVVTRLPSLGPKVDVALWGVAPVFHHVRWRPTDGKTVLGVSKHAISKEFDVLVAALPRLAQRGHNLQLVLTGRPDETPWSRRSVQLAYKLGVDERVCFTGDVPNRDMPSLMLRARAVVLPTWCESFGLPVAEGLAMGAPTVAADIPACREVGADGACYYNQGDPESLADALDALLTSPSAVESLTRRALQRGKTFSWRDNAVEVHRSLRGAVA
jgi:glycosyltransferase involved in cell wall biosynthesis